MFNILNKSLDSLRFDPLAVSEALLEKMPARLRTDLTRRKTLDLLLNFGIPFNRWLGMTLQEFSAETVTVKSPPSVLRRNHVGTAHACAQALIGEYAAGLLVAQQYPLETFRMIIGKLEIEYKKAGRGILFGTSRRPEEWPQIRDHEAWVPMETYITDAEGNIVAICKTNWQVKSWTKIASRKKS